MMDCMHKRHAHAEIQKRAQRGEFDWEEANPVYDGGSKASVEAVTIAVSVAATDNVSIAHPKLHVLLGELGMGNFVDAFAAHGIRTTKHWIDLDEEAQSSILIDLGVKKGLSTDQCELFMDRMDDLTARTESETAQPLQATPKGWMKRYSIVSKQHYLEHEETGETQWLEADE